MSLATVATGNASRPLRSGSRSGQADIVARRGLWLYLSRSLLEGNAANGNASEHHPPQSALQAPSGLPHTRTRDINALNQKSWQPGMDSFVEAAGHGTSTVLLHTNRSRSEQSCGGLSQKGARRRRRCSDSIYGSDAGSDALNCCRRATEPPLGEMVKV